MDNQYVCKMFGTFCCTFIPNNTSPNGSITKALEGLALLSAELTENSGISDPFTDMMDKWFGLSVVTAIVVTCAWCCIACLRGLSQRLIETTPYPHNVSTGRGWWWQQATHGWWRRGHRYRLKYKVPCMTPSKFSMICLMIIFGFIWKTNEHGNWTY